MGDLLPLGELVRVRDHNLPVLVVEEGGDGGVGEGGDEGPEGLEGGHPDPAALVPQQVDEERAELGLAHGGRAHAGDGHEDVGAGLPHPPHPVLAQIEELRQLRGGS